MGPGTGCPKAREGAEGLQQHRHKSTWDCWARRSVKPRWDRATLSPASSSLASAVDLSCPCTTGSGSWGKGWIGVAAGLKWPLEFAGSHCLSGLPTHFCTSFGKFSQLSWLRNKHHDELLGTSTAQIPFYLDMQALLSGLGLELGPPCSHTHHSHLSPGKPSCGGWVLSLALLDLPPNQNNTFPQILQVFYSVDGILSWFWFSGTDLFVVAVFLSLIISMGCGEKRDAVCGPVLKIRDQWTYVWVGFKILLHYSFLFLFSCLFTIPILGSYKNVFL